MFCFVEVDHKMCLPSADSRRAVVSFWRKSPYEVLPIAQENKYLGIFFLFYREIVCCVYSLELPH